MIPIAAGARIWIATGHTDMRKGMQGLALLVQEGLEPTLNQTFAAMAEHYDTTILPTRSRKPRDKGKVEGAVLIVERWILARLRHRRFFNLTDLNAAIADLLEELNNRPMRHIGKSRRQLFEEIERQALAPLPGAPFEFAEGKTARVHPDYHVEVDKTFYSVPHRLIGRRSTSA